MSPVVGTVYTRTMPRSHTKCCSVLVYDYSGSNMATSLAHDIGELSNSMGSSIYYCSLDAEGTFDMLPHSILLLQKAIDLIPDSSRLLVHYMKICIRWGKNLSEKIQVTQARRFIFNVPFQCFLRGSNRLQSCKYGVNISSLHLNTVMLTTYCYVVVAFLEFKNS